MKIVTIEGYGYDSNVYLIVENDTVLLIDSGTGYYTPSILEEIRKHTSPENISSIILTHRHFDHSGGSTDISKIAGCDIFIHEKGINSLVIGDPVTTCAKNFRAKMFPVKAKPLGDTFEMEENIFKIIHTPGHTSDSVSIYHEESGSLISGDTVFASGGIGRWDLPTGNAADLSESLKKLEELDVKHLYPGHGDTCNNNCNDAIKSAEEMIQSMEHSTIIIKKQKDHADSKK